MFRISAWHLAAALLVVAASTAFAQNDHPYAPGRVIVKFREPAVPGASSPLPASASAKVVRRFHSGAELVRLAGISVEDAVARYAADPRVEYAEPDYVITAAQVAQNLPDDPRFPELWGMNNTGQTGGTPDADIDAPEAWSIRTGSDVLIGVIDTGIDWNHEDLAPNVWVNPGEIPGNGIDDDHDHFVDDVHGWDFVNHDNSPMDDNGHGTHVSGTIAAVGNNGVGVAGVCWRARLVAVKILDAGGEGTMSTAIAGIEYAAAIGVQVMSCSWGSLSYSRALDDELAAVAQTNVLVVAAAGNNGRDNDYFPFYPSSYGYDNIIAVANTNDADTLSVTSNYGAQSVDLSAPGEHILSLLPGNRYGYLSGTSMATPHVTGTIGLVLAQAPLMTAQQVKSLLLATVDPIPALQGRSVSGGRLNAYHALASLDSIPPAPVTDLEVEATGTNTVTLAWTASGDDGRVGTAAAYDIRYADTPIHPRNFDDATRVAHPPRPAPSGARESFRVTGLDAKTTYFFALRVLDERENASPVSRMAPGRTRGEPEVSYTPGDFGGAALSGAAVHETLQITNTGKGTVDFAIAPGAGGWASARPDSGSVGARQTVDVTVTLDAMGLAGGEYSDTLVMATNDPGLPSAALPAHLTVTSAPQVAVSDTAVDFGGWLVGARARRELRVSNRGDRPLSVTSIAVAPPDAGFSTDVAPFTLAPADSHAVAIDFAPTATGVTTARLRIASNDPDEPDIAVALTGRGLPPPAIDVAPSALTATLHSGAATRRSVTIANTGTGDLAWNLSIDPGTGVLPVDTTDTGGEAPFRDLAGVRILYDAAHYDLQYLNYEDVFNALKARGAEVVVGDSLFTRTYLDRFDVVWMADPFVLLTPQERAALADWVRAGAGLVLEGDYDETVANFKPILERLLAGVDVSLEDGTAGITNNIYEHVTTRGVHNVYLSYVKASLRSLWRPAMPLIDDPRHVHNTAWSRTGKGRIVVMADQNFANYRMGKTGNLTLANRVFDWLALGVAWVTASPWSGVVPPSASQTIALRVDATGVDGPFDARLVVRSNDPKEPVVSVPVHLDATPAPDVSVDTTQVQLPATAVGDTTALAVRVGNIGTAALAVDSVRCSTPGVTVAPHAATLSPGEGVALELTYIPASVGEDTGVLSFVCNDPDEGTVAIDVRGEAVADTSQPALASAARMPARPSPGAAAGGPPKRTVLHPCVPNPFNPSTTIAYDLRDPVRVTIVIYNVRGEHVRTLVDAVEPAGRYRVPWNGRSDAGAGVATGIYFCRMVAGGVTQIRKLVLLK